MAEIPCNSKRTNNGPESGVIPRHYHKQIIVVTQLFAFLEHYYQITNNNIYKSIDECAKQSRHDKEKKTLPIEQCLDFAESSETVRQVSSYITA